MTHQLTQKERLLLQDQLNHEEMCIKKYSGYARHAQDQEVKRMFNEFAQMEESHYNTLQGFLGGQGGQTGQIGQGGQAGQGGQTGRPGQGGQFRQGEQNVQGRKGEQQAHMAGEKDPQHGGDSAKGSTFRPFLQETGILGGLGIGLERPDRAHQGPTSGTQADEAMLTDMLMTEKYISGTYDTTIFETVNPNIRQALQHIQKEEQHHGEKIFKHMQDHGMYTPQ